MGAILLEALLPKKPDEMYDAEDIGAVRMDGWISASAMRLGSHPDAPDQLVYLGETPVHLVNWHPKWVQSPSGQRQPLFRLEVKAVSGGDISVRDDMVIAEHPYANGLVSWAQFKPTSKVRKDKRPEPPSDELRSVDHLVEWIDSLPFDYWESGPFLTAGILKLQPPRNFVNEIGGQHTAIRKYHEVKILIGCCKDFESEMETLSASEEARRIIDDTLQGERKFAHPAAGQQELDEKVMIYLEEIMKLSICQAIAGPHDEWSSAKLIGKPVIKTVGNIFDGHINRLNKRKCRLDKKIQGAAGNLATDVDVDVDRRSLFEGLDEESYERIAQDYKVKKSDAVYMVKFIIENGIYEYPEYVTRVLRILAEVLRVPHPEPGGALLKRAVEDALEDEDLKSGIEKAEHLLRTIK